MKEPQCFKCEDSLWQMLADGTKTWDARRYDMSDDRIYRLSRGQWKKDPTRWLLVEQLVCFQNKATGEVLTFRFSGLEFAPWAPGWCFIILGGLVVRPASTTQETLAQPAKVSKQHVPKPESALLTIGEAARFLGLHPNTLRRWSDQGLIPTHHISARGDRRFRKVELDQFVEQGVKVVKKPASKTH